MYEVSYSARVIAWLKDLIARNRSHATELVATVEKIDHRLRVYPSVRAAAARLVS